MRGGHGGNLAWLQDRETGTQPPVGHNDRISKMLYSSVDVQGFWDPGVTSTQGSYGGIFNFDFATDGSVLVAACEGKSFLVFDPANYKLVNARAKAHNDCVNCVRFLDTRSFVTCSDDTSVVLWDLRFMKNSVRSFLGHSNWVKNIEYASSLGLLVTSGFDGAVYTWNINNYSNEEDCKRVFYIEGLMRCKLTPDDSKLVISTSRGYLLLVHDLDLSSLDVDMENYKSGPFGNNGCDFHSLFKREKNRLEIVNEFPEDDKAEIIASLQVHPQGWCVVSRNTSADEDTEWTCVHDIHSQALDQEDDQHHSRSANEQSEASGGSNSSVNLTGAAALSSPSSSEREDVSARTNPPLVPGQASRGHQRRSTSNRRPFRVAVRHTDQSGSMREVAAGGEQRALVQRNSSTPPPGESQDESSSDDDDYEFFFGEIDTSSSSEEEVAEVQSRTLGDFSTRSQRRNSSLSAAGGSGSNGGIAGGGQQAQGSSRGLVATDHRLFNFFMWSQRPRPFTWEEFGQVRSHHHHSTGSPVDMPSVRTISHHLSAEQRRRATYYINQQQERPWRHRPGRMLDLRNFAGFSFSSSFPLDVNGHGGLQLYKSRPRLIYAKQEPNVGRGFIKEQCFSTDGRLIISPWGNGVRMLAFDERCRELCDCEPCVAGKHRSLHELRDISMHPHVVLTTRFSPTHPLFVSGSRDGSVAFMTPCP